MRAKLTARFPQKISVTVKPFLCTVHKIAMTVPKELNKKHFTAIFQNFGLLHIVCMNLTYNNIFCKHIG